MRFATKAVHVGQDPEAGTGAVVPPIYQTTTYAQPSPGVYETWDYSRAGNPTRDALEENLAALEGAAGASSFSSGMAAISALVHLLPAGSHVICGENVYGGTHRMFSKVYEPMGYTFSFVDTRDLDALEDAFTDRTRLVFLETPSNPLMHVTDIAAVAERAHARGAEVAVDNTFLTPYWQNPLAHGADHVVHSATKYLGGHSDVMAGFVATRHEEASERLHFLQKCVGGVPGPFDCWLLHRGIKTLAVRMEAHERNARALAGFLAEHPKVGDVYYPGLPGHPGLEVQARQARGAGGGMISFDLGSLDAARTFCENLELFTLAESLGAVETLVSVPALMTHVAVPEEHRKRLGIHPGLVRLSVGIEDVDDLREELDRLLS